MRRSFKTSKRGVRIESHRMCDPQKNDGSQIPFLALRLACFALYPPKQQEQHHGSLRSSVIVMTSWLYSETLVLLLLCKFPLQIGLSPSHSILPATPYIGLAKLRPTPDHISVCLFDFQDKISVCSPGYSRTHSEDQTGFKLTEIHLFPPSIFLTPESSLPSQVLSDTTIWY